MQSVTRPLAEEPHRITDTAEFKQAVAEATASALGEAVPKLLAELMKAREIAGGSSSQQPGDEHWVEKLTMGLAQLNDPGRQLIAPEVVARRASAAKRLQTLLIEAYTAAEVAYKEGDEKRALSCAPQYRLVAKTQLAIGDSGPQVVEPLQRNPHNNRVYPTRIRWFDVPNLAMEPANHVAKPIMDAFLESIGNLTPDVEYPVYKTPLGAVTAPPPGGLIEKDFELTSKGNVVSGLSGAQIAAKAHLEMGRNGLVLDEEGEVAMPNAGGPPYVDVQVLGTLAPSARQNG
jgi:hypothetical protein